MAGYNGDAVLFGKPAFRAGKLSDGLYVLPWAYRDSWGQEKVSWIVLPTNYQVELANSAWVIKHALIPA